MDSLSQGMCQCPARCIGMGHRALAWGVLSQHGTCGITVGHNCVSVGQMYASDFTHILGENCDQRGPQLNVMPVPRSLCNVTLLLESSGTISSFLELGSLSFAPTNKIRHKGWRPASEAKSLHLLF